MRKAALLFSFLALAASPSRAANDLGASGPFRLIGGDRCGADYRAQRLGACDPAPVDPVGLTESEVADARVARARKLLGFVRVEAATTELDAALQATAPATLRHCICGLACTSRISISWRPSAISQPRRPPAIETRPSGVRWPTLNCNSGAFSEALREADQALAEAPGDPDALWIRSLARMAAGQRKDAEQDLDIAVRDRGNFRARLSRAELYLEDGRFEAAETDADLLIEARPSDFASRNIRALARLATGKVEGALSDLTSMIGPPGGPYLLPPNHQDFRRLTFQRAMLLVRSGEREAATKDIDYVLTEGGIRSVLQLQMYLRKNGFPDIALDGKRTQRLDQAMMTCFVNLACGRGVARAI